MDENKTTANNFKKEKEQLHAIPRGKPKGGRTWKLQKGRFSAISRPKSLKMSYDERIKLKTGLNHTRSIEKEMWKAVNEKRDNLRKRQKENKERRLENERKGEIVQVIKNPAKIKRMKKKQLKSIQKRDLDKVNKKPTTKKVSVTSTASHQTVAVSEQQSMYNGIGLNTPRGTGTNGYVQKNLSFVNVKRDRVTYVKDADVKQLETLIERKGNVEILEHEKKRRVELKCAEMRDMMLSNNYDEETTKRKVQKFRKMLIEREGLYNNEQVEYDEHGRPVAKETHQLAQANEEKNRKLREALGLGEYNPKEATKKKVDELKEAERRKIELAQRQYTIIQDEQEEEKDDDTVNNNNDDDVDKLEKSPREKDRHHSSSRKEKDRHDKSHRRHERKRSRERQKSPHEEHKSKRSKHHTSNDRHRESDKDRERDQSRRSK
ncbi:unnamed protein product [Didymodactylos carnosus]|nr:unnamed protein product [Didymodactylos carnosus]CAF3640863.1 unnamed protein product [Didymodactylos carnosus]